MDTMVSHQQVHYQDLSRPGSSSSTSSSVVDQLAYPPSSQSSLAFQQHYQQQHHHHHQQPHHQQPHHQPPQAPKDSPGSSSLQISTINSSSQDHDADEQTAHPSRMQPQFPPPQHQQHISHTATADPHPIKSTIATTGFSRTLTHREQELLAHLDRLKFFLATAPSRWNAEESDASDPSTVPVGHPSSAHPALNRFLLPNSEYVSCVLWGGLYHITGTDIVRALVFRFEAFGRPVRNMKKFEEGVFSDLRNLKPGTDACLEEPKSPFLDLLFKYQCIRTQKKQKVFYWFSVPHDRLFLDALERDLKREKMGLEPTTIIAGEPALSFTYDPKRSLYEQFCKAQGGYEGEGELEAAVRRADEINGDGDEDKASDNASSADEATSKKLPPTLLNNPNTPFASMFSLFEGSPTYKQRRKKTTKKGSADSSGRCGSIDDGGGHYPVPAASDPNRMTAADLFMAQARGEFGFNRLNEQSTHPRAATLQADHQQLHNQPVRGRLESRNTFPIAPETYSTHNSHRPQPPQTQSATLPGDWPYMDTSQSSDAMSMVAATSTGKTKAFVCPLFSCGRMFKRMEHLKRHLRTHTMERPFQCQRCSKKFSRSDNLTQHIRIHLRMDAEAAGGTVGFMVDESIFDDGLSGDAEDVDELDADNAGFLTDMRLCEVEVQGNIHDVQGDEEGLVTTDAVGYMTGDAGAVAVTARPDAYYSGSNSAVGTPHYPLSSSPEPAVYNADASPGVQWLARTAPSPAFSSASMPSPQSRMSSVAPTTAYNSMGEFITSASAPSHKATFDHGSMYSGHVHGMSPGPGPVRRHRSVTPSFVRYGETIRRPYSAAMTDLPTTNSRSYHPYAVSGNSHSGSAQSSPGTYHVPLDYGSSMSGHIPIAVARSGSEHGSRPGSSHLQDQMNQMLNLDSMDPEGMGYTSEPGGSVYGGIYRTDSPAGFVAGANGGSGHQVDNHPMYMHPQAQYGNHSFYTQGQPQSVQM